MYCSLTIKAAPTDYKHLFFYPLKQPNILGVSYFLYNCYKIFSLIFYTTGLCLIMHAQICKPWVEYGSLGSSWWRSSLGWLFKQQFNGSVSSGYDSHGNLRLWLAWRRCGSTFVALGVLGMLAMWV